MRLRSVEAIRYGALRAEELGPLGDGLTVVVGANEAGKSTFATLVRHVLFGYPGKNKAERGYHLDAEEKRAGQLVFEDDDGGRWVLMRTDGRKGGTPELVGPEGQSDAQAFIDRISAGVSPDVYRQVFGFSLDELADFRSLDAIQDHLHAGVTGLESNPRKALTVLEERAGALYLARGRREINELDRGVRDVKKRRRELSRAAGALTAERQELARLETVLADRRARLDEAVVRSEHLAALFGRIGTQTQQLEVVLLDIKELERAIEGYTAEMESADVDAVVLERASAIEALLARVAEFEGRSAELRELDRELTERVGESDTLARALGAEWSGQRARAFQEDPALEGLAEDFALRSERYAIDVDTASAAVERSRAALADAEGELQDALISAGLEASAGQKDVATAQAEVDRSLSATGSPTSRPAGTIVLALLGVAIAGWGLFSGDIVTVALGIIALAAAVVAYVVRSRRRGGVGESDAGTMLKRKGCLDVASERAKETAKMRRQVAADEGVLAAARDRVGALAAEWESWCAIQDLDGGAGPGRAREIVRLIGRLADSARRVADAEREAGRSRSAIEAYQASAREVGIETQGTSPEALAVAVRALGVRLAEEQEQHALRSAAGERRENAREALAKRVDERTLIEDALGALLAEAGVDSPAKMEGEVTAARQGAAELREEVASLSSEHGELLGRLQAEGGGEEQSRLSLQEAELTERLAAAIEEYAVAALAVRMLSETLGEYERDRQPDVIHRAEEVFSAMTDGRYMRISTPLGEFDPAVFDSSDRPTDNERLSTGTAQQLYLALRLAYIQSLGERAPDLPILMDDILVNFDDDRRARTAKLLMEFARGRQVVLFTCHESTADVFAAADSQSARRIEI